MTPAIRASRLTKRFGQTMVLDDIALEVQPGECLGVTGTNGAGRTTLLRILATLSPPSSGRLEIAGIDAVRRVMDARAHVMYVGPDLLPGDGLLVREYLDIVRAARPHTVGAPLTVPDVVARAGLPGDAPIRTLSSGFRQRLALAAGILAGTPVLLLDDPLRGLDQGAKTECLGWLREIRDGGTAMVATFYDADDEALLCHRLVHMGDGRASHQAGRDGAEAMRLPPRAVVAGDG
ncbi:MAG: ABC transporter ATP-binding protein [Acidobacteriota bacterium]